MEIKEEQKDKAIVFRLKGRLDSTNSPEVEKKICDRIDGGNKNIILDFSGLDYISSAGIRVLVHCHKKIEHLKGQIFLVAIPKPIENVLYITGFLPYFKIFESDAQALENLK